MKRSTGLFSSGLDLRALSLLLLLAVVLTACGGHQPAPVRFEGSAVQRTSGAFGTGASVVSVRRGDTVYAISKRAGASVRAIIDHNHLRPPYTLKPGQKIKIPAPLFHMVRKGETIYSISRRYGIDMASLARANYVRRPYNIQVNQQLAIPGKSSSWTQTAKVITTQKNQKYRSKTPVPAPPKRSGKKFSWPVRGKLLSTFGPKPGGLHNDGINIAVKIGANIRAAENGVVAYSGNELRGFGNLLLLRHSGGWVTAYAHNDLLLVKRGDRVNRSQVIAKAGSSGSVKTPQLHFEIRKGATAVNPQRHLMAAVILPAGETPNTYLATFTSAQGPTHHTDPG